MLRLTPVLPLAAAHARFQPVAVEDVAEAFTVALRRPDCIAETYELGGPEIVTLAEIVARCAHWLGLRRFVIALPHAFGWLQAAAFGLWPFANKPLSLDNFHSLALDSVLTSEDGLQRLGIAKTPMARVMPEVLRPRD